MTSDCVFCINRRSLYLLLDSHVFRLYDPATHYQASFYRNVGMLQFKHSIILRQSKWRWCLKTYNSVLTLFVTSLFSFVMHFNKTVWRSILKIYKIQFHYLPFLYNYSLRTVLSALNAFSFGRCLILSVTASNITYCLVLIKPIMQTFCLPLRR